MRTIHSHLLVLLLLGAACCCHGAGITLTFDPALERVMPNLVFGSTAVTAEVDLIHANKTRLTTVDFHLSPFMVPAAITASGNYTSKPIAIASMCLASNVGSGTGLTLQQIGAALSGSASGPTVGIRWHVAQPTMSPASALLLQTLVLNGIAPFMTTASWPASVLSNPNVVLLADDPSISFALSNCPSSVGCVGPQLGFAPWSAPMSCLRIRRTVTLTGDSISYTPALTSASARYTVVDPQFGVAYAQGPVYPFIGGIYLSARKTVTCRVVDALNAFFTNSTNQAALSSLGLQAVSNGVAFTTINMMAALSNGPNCTSTVLTTTIKGDPNLADAISTLNFNAVMNGANSSSDSSSSSSTYSNSNRNSYSTVNYMVGFAAATTAAILNDVYNPQTKNHAALVEGLPNATLNATSTSIATAPIFAHGLALIYTLDGRDGLVASLCTILGILNGTIQYWDDPAMMADNIGIDLPHLKITRIMSSDASQEAVGRGVSYIARRCGVPLTSVYSSYPFGTDVPAVTSRVVAQIQIVEGAIGFASTSAAIAASMQQLAILFPSEQQVSGTVTDLSAVSALLTVDASTNAIVFPPDTVDYFPFVAIVYAVVDTNANGSCTSYKKTLGWLKYAAGSKAQDPLQYGNQVVLSSTIRALTTAAIARVRCDGVAVYPVTVRTPAPTPVADVVWWPYAVSVGAVVALIALFGGRAAYRWWVLSVRPTDPTKAIAVMFVGIKNQAAVLEAGEENATAVHARVADTIRYLVRKHGCYESRRIDSTTTMIVAKDATRAAACAEDIVLQLSVDVPWLETVMTHPMPQKKANVRGDMRHSETGSETSNAPHTGRRASVKRTASQPNSARREALVQHISLARQSPSPSPRSGATPPSTPPTRGASYVRNTSNPALRRITSQLESPHNAPSKLPSSVESKTQHTSTSHTGLTLQQCVPEVYVGLHWTHVMVDVQDDAVSYRGAGINTAACIADLAVGGQVIVSREFMDCLNVDLGDDDGGYHFATVGDGKSSDELVGMSLTTERFPEWLIARSALRRKSLEEKDNSDGNMIAAAMASADGALARRRIAVVSMLVRDLLREGADGRAPVIGETLAELLDIVTSNRGQIHSITDGVVTVTVGAGAPVAMAAVRAAQIAMEATELCVAIGVNSGSALVGNAMGGKAATVGRVVAGAALMRVAAARAAVPICATDVAKADLAAKFELATVDLIAAPWDRTKHVRCFAIVEERAQAEEGEWLYDMNDGFAPLEQRFDWHAMRQTCDGAPPVNIHSAFLCRQEPIISLSDDLYMALQQATEGAYVHDFYLSRLHTLGSFGFSSGCSVVV